MEDRLGQMSVSELGKKSSSGGSSGWISWIIVLGLLGGAAWYFRDYLTGKSAQTAAASSGWGGKSGKNAGGAVPVVVASVTHGDMPVYLRGLGSVTALNTVTVKSRVDGQIVSIAFTEGQFVKAGDLLIQIDPRPYQVQLEQAEGQLAKDEASLADIKVNAERYKALYKDEVIPKQQLDTQLSQVGVFEGSILSDKAQINNAKLQLTYCKILSPIGGRVGLRLVDPGNIIHASDTTGMLVITQMQPIGVLFSLPQDSLPDVYSKLRADQVLNVEALNRDNSNKIGVGKLLTIDNQIDPATGTYKLKAVFDNDNNGLFPNQFVNVRLLLDTRHGLSIVPAAAVQRGPQGNYVYLVEDKKAKVRLVTVALSEGDSVGISDGLRAGDVVVTDGQDKLQDNTLVDAASGKGAGKSGKAE